MYGTHPVKIAAEPNAAPGLYAKLMDFVNNFNPTGDAGHGALAGAGLGGLLAGSTSLMSGRSSGETGGDRRRRILRDALVGSAFGAGAGYALPTAFGAFQTAQDPPTKLDKQVEALSKEFKGDRFLGSPAGAVSAGSLAPIISRWRRGAAANAAHASNIRSEASNWQSNWLNSRSKFEDWVKSVKDTAWKTVSTQYGRDAQRHGAQVAHGTAGNRNPQAAGPAASAYLQKRMDALLHSQLGTSDPSTLSAERAKFHAQDLAKLRSDWGNLHLPDGAGGKLSLDDLMKQTQAHMAKLHGSSHPNLVNLTNEAFNQELMRHIERDAATTAGTPELLLRMMQNKTYTGAMQRPALKPMGMKGWIGTAAGLSAPLWIPAATDLGAYALQRVQDSTR